MGYPVHQVYAGDVLPIFFDTFDGGTGASITMTGLAVTDIEVYKDGSATQRASDAGYTLLDTDGIDFDGITGIHGFSIDTGDNTDAGFYTVGSWFHVVVSAVTVDAQTVSFVAAAFRIMAAESSAGVPKADVSHWLGTAAATPTVAGVPEVDVTHWIGTAAATPTVAGVPEVDVTYWRGGSVVAVDATGVPKVDVSHILGGGTYGTSGQLSVNVRAISTSTTAADNLELAYDGTGYAGGTTPQQVVLTTSGVGAVADGVLDEAITDHRAVGSLGAVLQPLHSGTCQAGGNTTTVVLATGASSANDYYVGDLIVGWVAADGTNKFADYISAYVGASRTATVTGIPVSPDATYSYVILPGGSIPGASAPTASEVADAVLDEALSGHTTEGTVGALFGAQHLHAGTAQAGGAASITLDATGSSTTVDYYKYNIVVIRSGTGAGQARQITAYSALRVATVSPAWTTQPSTDSEYVIIPLGIDASTPSAVATAVWAATRAANATAGSFGEYVNADTVRISGDATSADNLEAATDGTGFGFTGCTIPTVTTVTTLTGHTPQTGDSYALLGSPAGASVSADIAAIKAETASILTDTGTTLDTAIGTLTTNVATVDTVVDAIKVKTDSLTFTVAGQVDANVQSINDVTVAGDGGTTIPWGV